ncbi:elongation factor P hydroxylase [Marinomonas spartinae]|uniref:elongation factor P hydroxylase n=1 Tax=Marinomonas spartinae TaxID=1792290 RepID=UPI001FDF84AD|nr:elongation factor P hydroxylase [Marinomonas spartinae]
MLLLTAKQLVEAFDACFQSNFNTLLVSGADEPLYVPATKTHPALLYFRLDYPSSALHEISHWCIAGEERRKLEDYGYWYEPDTRTEEQQRLFETVEVKPQAVECLFHWAAGMTFRVSVDNLALPEYDASVFERAVYEQVKRYLMSGLPQRAFTFSQYLLAMRCQDTDFNRYMNQQYENNCR